MFEGMEPRNLARWLIVAAVVYLLFPYDLVPDLFGPLGRVDDLAAIALFAWLYHRHAKQLGRARASGSGAEAGGGGHDVPDPAAPAAFDPHAVLGIPRSASAEEIRAAYRSRMQEYHPDKVAHLGSELQKLAHEKSQDIQRAYRQLRA